MGTRAEDHANIMNVIVQFKGDLCAPLCGQAGDFENACLYSENFSMTIANGVRLIHREEDYYHKYTGSYPLNWTHRITQCAKNAIESATFLLSRRANPTTKSNVLGSPLELAKRMKQRQVVIDELMRAIDIYHAEKKR